MLKLSFILPCYNVALYVGRCIESIEHQDIPQSEYEVICVDDCSKDNTIEVIKDYQKLYSNISLICHTVNKTAGGARNTGMDTARGEYLWFVDPDDAIEVNIVSKLYAVSKRENLDILIFNYILGRGGGNEHKGSSIPCSNEVLTGQQFFIKYCPQKRMAEDVSIWRNLYKRSFCIDNDLRFPEIKSSQDVVFAWTAFLKAQRLYSIDESAYIVFDRADSTTGSVGRYKAINAISSSLLYICELLKLLQIRPIEEQYISDILFEVQDSINNDSRKVLKMSYTEMRRFYVELQKYKNKIDIVRQYMNRKTRMIFNYHLPYPFWQMMIWFYMFMNRRKRLKY